MADDAGEEFVVIWDGAHRGADLDLLNASLRVPVKQCGGDITRRPNAARDVILGLLRGGGRFTQAEICVQSGLRLGTVNDVIYHLFLDGRIGRQVGNRQSPIGRALREYYLLAGSMPGEPAATP